MNTIAKSHIKRLSDASNEASTLQKALDVSAFLFIAIDHYNLKFLCSVFPKCLTQNFLKKVCFIWICVGVGYSVPYKCKKVRNIFRHFYTSFSQGRNGI